MSDFRQEVETQEKVDRLQRELIGLTISEGELDIMITFSPDFQIKVDTLCTTVNLYQEDRGRSCFGWPWFSVMGQEEPFKIWQRLLFK